MAVLRVKPEKSWVRPGETLRVRLAWHLDAGVDGLEARLLWFTEGRGARDVGVAATHSLDGGLLDGEEEVSFTAPPGPYSFHGRLITLQWAVELATSAGDAERAFLVLAPTPVPVEL